MKGVMCMKMMKILCILILVTGVFSFTLNAFAAERTAKISILNGKAEVKQMGAKSWIPAEVGMMLKQGDMIRTKSNSWVMLNLNGSGDTANVEMEENSKLTLAELLQDESRGTQQTLLDLAMGQVLIKAQKLHTAESKFEVKTPTSIVGVRGTTFSVSVESVE